MLYDWLGWRVLYGKRGRSRSPYRVAPWAQHGVVEHITQGAFALAAVQTRKNFKVAFRNFVDKQATPQIKGRERHEVVGAAHLRLIQIGQQRAAGPHELRLALQPQRARILHALRRQNALCGAF